MIILESIGVFLGFWGVWLTLWDKQNFYAPWLLGIGLSLLVVGGVCARDLGQWEGTDPEVREWYKHLMMPDAPAISCCGEADAWWADSYKTVCQPDGTCQYIAIVTDTRDDAPLHRRHVPVGTEVVIPNNKLVDAAKQQNPTGHGILFMGSSGWQSVVGNVYCYLAPGGV